MKKIVLFLTGFFIFSTVFSQELIKKDSSNFYYAVYFADKNGTPYSTDSPEQFLSQKAIQKRKDKNIPVTEQDLPVNPAYVEELKKLGFKVKEVSKWLNCAIVYTDDSTLIDTLKNIDFIVSKPAPAPKNYKYKPVKAAKIKEKNQIFQPKYEYGLATDQNQLIEVDKLHSLGFDGKGVTMAIFDMGFFHVNSLPAFDSLWKNKQILGWYDFVENDTTVFDKGYHGMEVLSTIAGNTPEFVGTAPKASFWLFATEDDNSETQIEEYNWVCAAEKADSLGVDVINSSLGYNDFDIESTSYTYEDMNGNTAISTIGADIAASKGILVVVSAGNEGDSPWHYITAPSDGDSVLAVGATNVKGWYAYFSSTGPSSDGRVKPDVAAAGSYIYVQDEKGNFSPASGTSFSGPITAGAMACLVQAFPEKSNMEIINAVRSTATKSKKPDDEYGYGVAQVYKAYLLLQKQKE